MIDFQLRTSILFSIYQHFFYSIEKWLFAHKLYKQTNEPNETRIQNERLSRYRMVARVSWATFKQILNAVNAKQTETTHRTHFHHSHEFEHVFFPSNTDKSIRNTQIEILATFSSDFAVFCCIFATHIH